MKHTLFAILTLLIAVVGVIGTELGVSNWLTYAPFDVTGNFFLAAVLPAQIIVVGVVMLLLLKIFQLNPALYLSLFFAAHLAVYITMLNYFKNPLEDILMYVGAVIIADVLWVFLLRSKIWKPAAS